VSDAATQRMATHTRERSMLCRGRYTEGHGAPDNMALSGVRKRDTLVEEMNIPICHHNCEKAGMLCTSHEKPNGTTVSPRLDVAQLLPRDPSTLSEWAKPDRVSGELQYASHYYNPAGGSGWRTARPSVAIPCVSPSRLRTLCVSLKRSSGISSIGRGMPARYLPGYDPAEFLKGGRRFRGESDL
jgi:hypothetical protein